MKNMKRPSITPGPWEINEEGCNRITIDKGEACVCLMNFDDEDRKWSVVHAKAIAALPVLLDALEEALQNHHEENGSLPYSPDHWSSKAKSALLAAGYTEDEV